MGLHRLLCSLPWWACWPFAEKVPLCDSEQCAGITFSSTTVLVGNRGAVLGFYIAGEPVAGIQTHCSQSFGGSVTVCLCGMSHWL